ncbi:MAG TPA: hypothetical protein VNW92_19630 [Polyangiaceae bacterium]|jgi:hypothetical protein|nr:hypothetical protein [Polyangiaceae bacterium]
MGSFASRAGSLALPVVTVLVVTYSLLVAGVARTITGARVYGGPTEGVSTLSLRIETVTRDGEREAPAWPGPLHVRATERGRAPSEVTVARAVAGVAEAALELPADNYGSVALEVQSASGAVLARGDVALDVTRWAARARRRGGWIRGRELGSLVLGIAPERGTFVVGSTDRLWIRVERAGNPVPGATLTVSADGARLTSAEHLQSDARGYARVNLEPSDLNPTVHVEAHTEDGQSGQIESGVPVVPGGFHALVTPTGFRVETAVPRSEAYFSVVSDSARVSGGVLALLPDGRGGSVATAELAPWPHPAWLVVSSEVDENSVAAIGWPLDSGAEPAHTFDVPEALLLDGLPAAFAHEQARRSRVRWLTAAFIAGAFALSVALLVLRVRAAEHDIARHLQENLEAETARRVAPQRGLALLVGLLAVGLGFILLGLIVLARSH